MKENQHVLNAQTRLSVLGDDVLSFVPEGCAYSIRELYQNCLKAHNSGMAEFSWKFYDEAEQALLKHEFGD